MEASQGLDKNNGTYLTPLKFLQKVNDIWPIGFDLASDSLNNVMLRLFGIAGSNYTEKDDALKLDWPRDRKYSWLNPPFSNIKDWVERAAIKAGSGSKIIMLLPASQGSNWFNDFVEPHAVVVELIGRLTFDGHTTAYPKDMILAIYGNNMKGRVRWDWRK